MQNFHQLSLNDSFEVNGVWKLYGNEAVEKGGTLSYKSDEIKLVLGDPIDRYDEDDETPEDRRTSIVGQTEAGPVALFNWFWTVRGVGEAVYAPTVVIVGIPARGLDDITVSHFHFSFAGLEDWRGGWPLKTNEHNHERGDVQYTRPDPIVVRVPSEQMTLTVTDSNSIEHAHEQRQATIRFRTELAIDFDSPVPLKAAMAMKQKIESFFGLLFGRPFRTRHVGGKLHSTDEPAGVNCSVFYEAVDTLRERASRDQILLPYRRLGPAVFETAVVKWFENFDKLELVIVTFFGSLRAPSPFLNTRFFHTAQCLEVFHKQMVKRKRDFIDRMRDMLASLDPDSVKLVTDDAAKFADRVVNTRNEITHLEPDPARPTFPRGRWHYAEASMARLLRMLLLKACGVPEAIFREPYRSFRHTIVETYNFADEPKPAPPAVAATPPAPATP